MAKRKKKPTSWASFNKLLTARLKEVGRTGMSHSRRSSLYKKFKKADRSSGPYAWDGTYGPMKRFLVANVRKPSLRSKDRKRNPAGLTKKESNALLLGAAVGLFFAYK